MRTAVFILLASLSFCVSAASGRIFVSNERDDSVSVIDATTNTVIHTIPVGKRPRGVGLGIVETQANRMAWRQTVAKFMSLSAVTT